MQWRVANLLRDARTAVEQSPESAEAWGDYASALAAHEFYEDAATCYAQARALDPTEFRWMYLHAVTLAILGTDRDGVIDAFETAQRLDPTYHQVGYRLGHYLASLNEYDAAIEAHESAIAIDPNFGPAHRGLGQAYLATRDFDAAYRSLERAVDLMPDDLSAHAALAQAAMRIGKEARSDQAAARAATLTRDAILFDPMYYHEITAVGIGPKACFDRAKTALLEGRPADALEDLLIAEEGMPSNPYVFVAHADALIALSRRAEAIPILMKARELDDRLIEIPTRLGRVYHDENRLAEAVTWYERAAELEVDADVLTALGICYAKSGRLDDAESNFASAASVAPDDPNIFYNWSISLLQLQRPEEAATKLRRTIELMPTHADAHARLGRLLEIAGDVSGAIDHYRRAVAVNPNHPAAARLRALDPSFR